MAERLEVRLHGEQVGWITRGSRRERIEFEWLDGYTPGPVTLTESFGSIRPKAPSAAASGFFGGYALEGRQRERLTQRRGISNPTDLYAMLREFGSSIAGAVTIGDPQAVRTPRTSLSRNWRDAPTGWPGSTTGTRSPLSSASPITGRSLSAAAPASTWSSSATFTELLGDNDAHAKNFAKALDHVPVPRGVPAAAAAQLAWNVERLQSGGEIGERPSEYRRRRSRL